MRRSERSERDQQVESAIGQPVALLLYPECVMTPEQLADLELDRFTVMRVLRAERFSFPAMIPVLVELGLLECHDDHRFRVRRDNGESVCISCENNLAVFWKRGLARLGEKAIDPKEAKGAWFEDHEFIMQMCRENAIGPAKRTTTRTTETVEIVEGKEVKTTNTVRNVTEFRVINHGLLRLLSDVRDKMARVGGFNVATTGNVETTPSIEMHIHDIDDDGASEQPN